MSEPHSGAHDWFQSIVIGIEGAISIGLLIGGYFAYRQLKAMISRIESKDTPQAHRHTEDAVHVHMDVNPTDTPTKTSLSKSDLKSSETTHSSTKSSRTKTILSDESIGSKDRTKTTEPNKPSTGLQTIRETQELPKAMPKTEMEANAMDESIGGEVPDMYRLDLLVRYPLSPRETSSDSSLLNDTKSQIDSVLDQTFDDMIETVINMNEETLRYDYSSEENLH